LWERSTRSPLIIAGKNIAAGAQCNQPAELLDIYPTLNELCALPARKDLEGHSLVPQLRDATARRDWPAITSHGPNNHAIRTERWRYIRYADASEELYDMGADKNEWTNLAARAEFKVTKNELARWLPKTNAAPVQGSVTRLVEVRKNAVFWEGRQIGPDNPRD
jgi:choline-sulfatase